ncbi:MAG: response regulator [Arcobacteraceae bacterium]
MFDSGFFKEVTILYVEDDDYVRESLSEVLSRFFKKIITASNADEGYNKFLEDFNTHKEITLIISDINMPNKNGLVMIKEIKEVSKKIPFILLTAHNDSKYMLEAIRLGVSHYVLKPIIIEDLMTHIRELCEHIYQEHKIINQQKALCEYINIVDQVAIISSTDTKGIITNVNDIFCEVSGYTHDELIGKPHNMVRHPEMHSEVFKELWATIKAGNTWRGKVKNLAKDGSTYYVEAHIFPVFCNDNKTLKGYMGVRFLTTDIEREKRTFKQKVIKNLIENKSLICAYEETIENLRNDIAMLEKKLNVYDNMDLVFDALYKQKDKNARLLSQIASYEQQLESSISKNQEIAKEARSREQKALEELKVIKIKYDSLQNNMKIKDKELQEKEKLIVSYQERFAESLKINENLRDVIKFKEKQLSGK